MGTTKAGIRTGISQIKQISIYLTLNLNEIAIICIIQKSSPAVLQTNFASFKHVTKTAWGGNQKMTATVQLSHLITNIGTSITKKQVLLQAHFKTKMVRGTHGLTYTTQGRMRERYANLRASS